MAHLKAQESKDGAIRKGWKLRLVRLLYERGYTREQVLELFRVLDWMLRLPGDLEREFMCELIAFEEQAKMPYVTSVERLGRQQGREEGREEGREAGREEGREEGRQQGEALVLLRLITLKFGPPSLAVREQIATADAETLLRWSERILAAQTLDEVLQ
jgi:hypothetical protein